MAAPPPDGRRPPLFVVADGDSRVYLLGSVHVLPEGALPLPPAVEAAYRDASVLAFEIDADSAAVQVQALLPTAMDEPGVGVALDPDQKARFDAFAQTVGLPPGALDAFEPWMAALTVGVLAVQTAGVTAEGVDPVLFARAKADGKERVAFETVAGQFAALDGLPEADQVAFLMASVETGPEAAREMFGRLYAAWSEGEDETLAALMNEGMEATPLLSEALFAVRNRAFVPQIEALLARTGENALVVVGAGHLVGPDGVVELLRAAGYTVERL